MKGDVKTHQKSSKYIKITGYYFIPIRIMTIREENNTKFRQWFGERENFTDSW